MSKNAPLFLVVPEYTQAQEDALVASFSGQPAGLAILYNTNTLTLRRWTGSAFADITLEAGPSGASLLLTDVTTNDVNTSRHGFFPKLPTPAGKYLKDDLTWATIAGGGDVVGPASVTDDLPVIFDGTTGKLIKQKTYAAFKALLALVKGDVGLGNVDNTTDAGKPVSTATQTALDAKQETLISGTNIKTINSESILGNGDLQVTASVAWGGVTGTLSNQSDLQTALDGKSNTGHTHVKSEVGLASVDDTSDAGKPVSTATQAALDLKAPLSLYARVTGSNATTTGQTLVNVTGLSIALAINSVYELRVALSIGTSAVTTGTKYGINYSVAGATIEAGYDGTTTSTSNVTNRLNALNTATSTFNTTSAATNSSFALQGIITTGANAGNLTVQHLKVTSGTSTVFINSYMKVTKIA